MERIRKGVTSHSPQRVKILMSDTGGGHRASAEAILEAFRLEYGSQVQVELVDVFLHYAPYPFNRLPAWYPTIISRGRGVWKRGFHLSNGVCRTKIINYAVWPYLHRAVRRLVQEHPADVILSVHPLLVGALLQGLGKGHPPFVTVVTDLVSTHAWWFDTRADLTLVPTADARQRALGCGLAAERVKVLGLPVLQRFSQLAADQVTLRRQLGWHPNVITILLLGGSEGMGPLRAVATSLACAGLPIQLAVVCGRNESLRNDLAAQYWPVPTHLYGFVQNMPDVMRAADLLVTKAGPSSVTEALNCGRPLLLSGAIPGQEEGNVSYVVEQGAGWWAPGPDKVVAAVRELVASGMDSLAVAAANAQRMARPGAARAIVREISQFFREPFSPV